MNKRERLALVKQLNRLAIEIHLKVVNRIYDAACYFERGSEISGTDAISIAVSWLLKTELDLKSIHAHVLPPVSLRAVSKPDRRKNSRRTMERKVPTMGGLASSDRRQAARRQNDRTKKRLKEQYPPKK